MNKTSEKIANYLLEDEFFSGFKLRKQDAELIRRLPIGYEIVELQNWIDTDSSSGKKVLIVHPLYLTRFNILHKWFEKFSFKTLSDQRGSYSIGFDGSMLDTKNEYHFPVSDNIFPQLDTFRNDIITNAKDVFNKFKDLSDLYKYLVYPVIAGEKAAPDVGADWVFQYLLLTKIVDKRNYKKAKIVIMDRVEELQNRGEPNIERYYEKLDDILFYLENENIKYK